MLFKRLCSSFLENKIFLSQGEEATKKDKLLLTAKSPGNPATHFIIGLILP